jgi:integrase
MSATKPRKVKKPKWPKLVTLGNVSVTVYKRTTPNGKIGYMLAYKQDGKRKFDSYGDEAEALEKANKKAQQLSTLGVKASELSDDDLRALVAAMDILKPLRLTLGRVVEKVVEAVEIVGSLENVPVACRFFVERNKRTTPKRVADVVTELLAVKETRGAAPRYIQDLRNRLTIFAESFAKDAANVTTADLQAWFDAKKFGSQNFMGYRRVIHLLFEFAIARGYAVENPAAMMERVKVKHGATQIFTPAEITRLLACASADFMPSLAIGAFAGLRSAEIERLEWSDIDLAGGHITVGADKAKTASRRVVPICANLGAWLATVMDKTGNVWKGDHNEFYYAQEDTAAATAIAANAEKGIAAQPPVKWKANALRHSYASYRFAQTGDAGRVAGELGNSAAVVHKHYRELVKPADAVKYFSVTPEQPANVVTLPASAAAN